jgi:hypothetical protein
MAIFRSSRDLNDRQALKSEAYKLFSSYTWAGGPTAPVGRLLADKQLSSADAIRILLSGILQIEGATGVPSRALADEVAREIVSDAVTYDERVRREQAERIAADEAQKKAALASAMDRLIEQMREYPPTDVLRGAPWSAELLAKLSPAQRERLLAPNPRIPSAPASVGAVLAPLSAPSAQEESHMSMLNAGLKTAGQIISGAAGIVKEVAEAAAPVVGSVLGQALQTTTAGTTQATTFGPLVGTAARVLTSPAVTTGVAAAGGALGSWLFSGEGTPTMFSEGPARVRPVPRITVPHPQTGEHMTWVYAGRPILYSRDLAVVRRVQRLAARAHRSSRRGRAIVRRIRRKTT